MTNSISLFEAKAHFSELVRQVAETGQSVAISVRGKPRVRLVPYDAPTARPDAWEAREKLAVEYGAAEYGSPDFTDQGRAVIKADPLFNEEDL
jgi:prevent-host-death family protein